MAHAFRCRKCGHLHAAGHAGENFLPHSCAVCDAGVVHSPIMRRLAAELADPKCSSERRMAIAREMLLVPKDEAKEYVPSNWEVLHECSDERLAELGLQREHVCKHEPAVITVPRLGYVVHRAAADVAGAGEAVVKG